MSCYAICLRGPVKGYASVTLRAENTWCTSHNLSRRPCYELGVQDYDTNTL